MITRQSISSSLIGLAGIAVVGTLGWFIYSWSVTHTSKRTVGHVVELVEKHYQDIVYCPVFVFQDASGVEHTVHSTVGNPPRFPVGSTVSVLYRESDPADAQIEDRFILWIAPVLFLGLSMIGGTVGFMLRPQESEVAHAA